MSAHREFASLIARTQAHAEIRAQCRRSVDATRSTYSALERSGLAVRRPPAADMRPVHLYRSPHVGGGGCVEFVGEPRGHGGIVKLSEVGAVANHISLMRHI